MSTNTGTTSSQDSVDQEQSHLLRWLSLPASYPEPTKSVTLVETHISWVFLTDRFVYKLKKPVRFDFLDFSTLPRREEACRQEVALNRRLAEGIYLGVVSITRDRQGRLGWGGSGSLVDWVVKMRRLPAAAALDQRIASGQVREADIEKLAARLASFYQSLPPLTVKTDDYRQAIRQHVDANEQALLDAVEASSRALVRRTHIAQRLFLQIAPDMLDNRVRDGRIVNGHGDLRPEHIYLTQAPVVIDCVEFSSAFRTIDVIDELGFLAMECDHLQAHWVGERVMQSYLAASHDDPPAELIQFYQSYRACVRAKVHALRARQVAPAERSREFAEVARYLELAQRDAMTFSRPLLLVIRGLPGSGKSTLASALAEQMGCELLQTDVVRQELYGAGQGGQEYDAGHYSAEGRLRVYQEMLRRAESCLREGISVILDGTFLQASLRSDAVALARQCGAQPLVVRCVCPAEIARSRIAERQRRGDSPSETRVEFYERQLASDEPDPPGLPVLPIDSTLGNQIAREAVFTRLRQALLGSMPQASRA